MLTLFRKFLHICNDRGAEYTLSKVKSYIDFKFGIQRSINKRRNQISSKLDKSLNSTIAYGPFKGFKFSKNSWWGGEDRAGMLLGLYEQEVLQSLAKIPSTHKLFIDLGAADGYYGIGVLVNGMFDYSYCFELSETGRNVIANNAEINGVAEKVAIHGIADKDFYKNIPSGQLSRSVLFVDIEGGEFDLFDKELFEVFKQSIIFIEIHEDFFKDGKAKIEKMKEDASQYFNVNILTTSNRDLSIFSELKDFNDNDRWLICSEGRRKLMTWFRFDPKHS